MDIFNSEQAKRGSKIFDKVLQSKRLRGIKNRAKKNKNNYNILLRASKASEEKFWLLKITKLTLKMDKKQNPNTI